jgi:ribosome-binding protein aMBF1 (putative translation factor)
MSDINKDVGFNIRTLRQEKGLSQEKLAALADLQRAYWSAMIDLKIL